MRVNEQRKLGALQVGGAAEATAIACPHREVAPGNSSELAHSRINAILTSMSRMPSNRSGENFIEFALMIILLSIVMLSILLIVGDSIREFANDFGLRWSLSGPQSHWLPGGLPWIT